MSDRLRSMLTRVAAYVGVMVAAGLLFLAAMSVYQMMWPKPVVPFGRWVIEKAAPIAMPRPINYTASIVIDMWQVEQVDGQLEFRRSLNRKLAWLGTPQP